MKLPLLFSLTNNCFLYKSTHLEGGKAKGMVITIHKYMFYFFLCVLHLIPAYIIAVDFCLILQVF